MSHHQYDYLCLVNIVGTLSYLCYLSCQNDHPNILSISVIVINLTIYVQLSYKFIYVHVFYNHVMSSKDFQHINVFMLHKGLAHVIKVISFHHLVHILVIFFQLMSYFVLIIKLFKNITTFIVKLYFVQMMFLQSRLNLVLSSLETCYSA